MAVVLCVFCLFISLLVVLFAFSLTSSVIVRGTSLCASRRLLVGDLRDGAATQIVVYGRVHQITGRGSITCVYKNKLCVEEVKGAP